MRSRPAVPPLPLVACVALALLLHGVLVLGRSGLFGGGDLVPHLRLVELTRAAPGLHNPYAPAYHGLGALLAPLVGLALYPKLFALGAAVLLLAGFRAFQRAAALPDETTALFALTPFLLSLSWCTPRVEAAGYGLLLFGLAALLRRRHATLALLLAGTFYVHTASALLFGIAGGVLALARRDARGLLALALGSLGAAPLVVAQLGAGCTLPEAFLFARGGYARPPDESLLPRNWPWLVPLAGPVGLAAAALGARATARASRPLALLCAVLLLLYLSNVWLAPFGQRTLVTPLRGLSVLAIPVAIAAGVFAAATPARRRLVLGLAALYTVGAAAWVVPRACFVRPISLAELRGVEVERCTFVWRRSRRAGPTGRPAADGPVVRSADGLAGRASDGLVLVRYAGAGADLWRARLRDGALRPLLQTPRREEVWPFWSPAAERLVIQTRERGRSWQLALLDVRTGREAPLGGTRARVEHWAVWSPDGRRVAYAFASEHARGIAEVELATGERSVHTPAGPDRVVFRPEYAPDGRRLVAQSQQLGSRVPTELVILERGRPPRFLGSALAPFAHKARFSRDGSGILFTRRSAPGAPGDLVWVDATGGGARVLASRPDADDHSARPSPRRDEIAFVSDREGSPDLYRAALDGSAVRRLLATPDRAEAAPRWSPDGERIAVSVVTRDRAGRIRRDTTRVVVVDRDGRILLDVPGTMPDWMPPW